MDGDQGGNELNELFNEIKLHEPIKKIEVNLLYSNQNFRKNGNLYQHF